MPVSSSGLGPQRIDGISIFTRLLLGLIGGIAGFLLIFLSVLISGKLTTNFFSDDAIFSGVANFAILTSLFLSATVMNLVATYLSTLANQVKYTRIPEGLMQVLTANVILFLFTVGGYFLTDQANHALTLGIVVFHVVFSALASALVFEITATRWSYPLITVYDALLGTFAACVFLLVLYQVVSAPVVFLFGVPVVLWSIIGFVSGLTEYLYYQAYKRIGVDFLQSRQVAAADAAPEESFDESESGQPF